MSNVYQIAIDGPSGSGKSTLAKGAAKALGIMYLDTGAMYRTCGLCAMKTGIAPKDEDAVRKMLADMKLEIKFQDGIQHMILNGEDVTDSIRTPEVSRAASDISSLPFVRTAMVDMQRKIAADQSFVVDGRDIGSVVLPNAKYKFFLTASAQARAKRRCLELEQKGTPQPLDEVLKDIIWRDKQDSERAASPLIKVDDAVEIDTSEIGIEETLEVLLSYIRE
ncbi:MAG: (d)CMP kinase [Clostridiales bacterium]|nr:(d)CMP kinase [Clostridiales bacterium]